MHITNYREALAAIWHRSGYDRGYISNPFAGDDAARLGLERTRLLLERAGFAELPYAIVHVAGSKGKGSTCTIIDSILQAAGLRTGRYLSPHLHSFRERFVVNGELISEEDFVSLTAKFVAAADKLDENANQIGLVTAFELTTAMALAWFADSKCDTAVIEVGMGGTLDSTNIVDPAVSVITTLDFEHTAILGSTMAEVAANKAGIIKLTRPVLTAKQPHDAMEVIAERAASQDAPLHVAGRDWQVSGDHTNFAFDNGSHRFDGLECGLVGPHQVNNAGLAIAAVLTLRDQGSFPNIDESAIRDGVKSANLPARFERMDLPSGQVLIIDGAHTPASTAALSATVQQHYPGASATIVIGMLADKAVTEALQPLAAIATNWIIASLHNPRAMSATELRDGIEAIGHPASMAADVASAIDSARKHPVDLIIVTGSFVTAAEARVALGLATTVDPPM